MLSPLSSPIYHELSPVFRPSNSVSLSKNKNDTYLLIKQLLLGGIPTIFCLELSIITQFINVYFIGHLNDPVMLGGLGVALIWLNSLVYSGFLTLSAQAFGKKDFRLLGLYFQRGCLINLVICLISTIILFISTPILTFFGLEEKVVDLAMDYIFYSIPSVFFYAYYDIAKSFLQVQKVFNPQLIIQLISVIFHFIAAYLFIDVCDMKLSGAGLARSCSDFLNFFLISFYVYLRNPHKESLFPLSEEALRGWKNYLGVSIPIAMSFYVQCLCYGFLTVIAGNLPNPDDLAAHVAMANTSAMFFFISLGLSMVMQNFVGNALGQANSQKAKQITKIGMVMNGVFIFVFFVFIMLTHKWLAEFYTQEVNVVMILNDLIILYAFLSAADFSQIFLAGVMKAIGKEDLALKIYLVVYYLFGLPLCFILAFPLGGGVYGLWLGWAIVLYVTMCAFGVIIYKVDWELQNNEIRERLLQDQCVDRKAMEEVEMQKI